jgi:hypothetical protein
MLLNVTTEMVGMAYLGAHFYCLPRIQVPTASLDQPRVRACPLWEWWSLGYFAILAACCMCLIDSSQFRS